MSAGIERFFDDAEWFEPIGVLPSRGTREQCRERESAGYATEAEHRKVIRLMSKPSGIDWQLYYFPAYVAAPKGSGVWAMRWG